MLMTAPLADITIIEAVRSDAPPALALAAGLCGRIAADLGARVMCAEGGALRDENDAVRAFLGVGKKRLHGAETATLVRDFASSATAIVVDDASYRAVAGDFGDAIPVVIAMHRQGESRPASEFTVEAQSGLLDLVGDPEREPLRLGGHQTAYAAGLAAYLGLIAALSRRTPAQRGPVRVNVLDVAVWLNWKTLGATLRNGTSPTRPGKRAEWAVAACADGHVALVYRAAEWKALLAATDDARLRDERFQSGPGRRANAAELNAILADVFSRMTRSELRDLALNRRLPFGPVWSPAELLDDAHMRAREFFKDGMPRLPVLWNGRTFAPAETAR